MLVPDAARAVHPQHRTGYLADRCPGRSAPGYPWPGAAGRQHFPRGDPLSAIDTDEGTLITAAVRDVTERQRRRGRPGAGQPEPGDVHLFGRPRPARSAARAGRFHRGAAGRLRGRPRRGRPGLRRANPGRQRADGDAYRRPAASCRASRRAEMHLRRVDLGAEASRIAAGTPARRTGPPCPFRHPAPVQARADRRLIRTVLQNLVDNAWKFTSGRRCADRVRHGAGRGRPGLLLRARQRRRL